jgi:hypothetical protein
MGLYFATRQKKDFKLTHYPSARYFRWWFAEDGAATKVCWRYTFKAKGWLSSRILPILAHLLWSGYIRVCLYNTQRHFEVGSEPKAQSSLKAKSVYFAKP